jgi:hypothetical protein
MRGALCCIGQLACRFLAGLDDDHSRLGPQRRCPKNLVAYVILKPTRRFSPALI